MTGKGAPAGGEGFDVRIAWRRDDHKIEADAIEMWTRLGVLPPDVTPESRAKQLVAAAYRGDRIVALCSAVIEHINFLRAKFLVLRSMTDPEFQRSHAQIALALPVKAELEAWAAAHQEEKIAGVIGFVAPGAWGDFARLPVAPLWAWTLVAYTHDGQQVRAVWFDDFRFE